MVKNAVGSDGNQPVMQNGDLNLTPEQQKNLLSLANANDAAAAMRLYYYYELVKSNNSEAMKWLKKAADLDSPNAKYTLGYIYFHWEGSPLKDPKAAKYRQYWIEEAAKRGDPEAIAALKKQ